MLGLMEFMFCKGGNQGERGRAGVQEQKKYSINTMKHELNNTLEGDTCYVKNWPDQGEAEVPSSGYTIEQNGEYESLRR